MAAAEDAEDVVLTVGEVGLGLDELLPRVDHAICGEAQTEHDFLLRGRERALLLDRAGDGVFHCAILCVTTNIVKRDNCRWTIFGQHFAPRWRGFLVRCTVSGRMVSRPKPFTRSSKGGRMMRRFLFALASAMLVASA